MVRVEERMDFTCLRFSCFFWLLYECLIAHQFIYYCRPLSTLPSFPALWLRLLDYMDRYLHTDRSDLLSEAIPESLKNMILVLDNTGMFRAIPGLYQMTVTRMGSLLPDLIAEVMPGPPERESL